MEAGEAASDVLLQRPWLPVNIGGCQLLAKSSFGDTSYHLLLTDTHCVWEERAAPAHIQQRAQVRRLAWIHTKRSIFADDVLVSPGTQQAFASACGSLLHPPVPGGPALSGRKGQST